MDTDCPSTNRPPIQHIQYIIWRKFIFSLLCVPNLILFSRKLPKKLLKNNGIIRKQLPWFELINIQNLIGLIISKERTNTSVLGISCSEMHLFLKPCLEKSCSLSASHLRGIVLCFWGLSVIQYEGASTHLSHLFSSSTNLGD